MTSAAGPTPILPPQRMSPAAGLPRPWEVGIDVSPYSVANVYNGNLSTKMDLVVLDGVRPPLRFTIYHNSAAATGGQVIASPTGFSLGPGWSVTYGGAVVDNGDGTLTLLEDDGNQYVFTPSGGRYVGPTGVHDDLFWDAADNQWVLTRASQWQRIFDNQGRLIEMRDSAGRVLTVERDPNNGGRISAIVSHQGARLDLSYDGDGRLVSLTDPSDQQWTFEYDGNDRLWQVHAPDPNGGPALTTTFTYTPAGRIQSVRDDAGNTWTYTYGSGMLSSVTDEPVDPNTPAAQQTLTYSELPINNRWETYYTDRQGQSWTFRFTKNKGRFRERIGPSGNVLTVTYDADGNVTSLDDGQGNTVTATWGPAATLQTLHLPAAGPEGWNDWNDITLYWEQPDPAGRPNFYRLTQMLDVPGSSVQYNYDDPNDPARATTLIEQEPGGDPNVIDGSAAAYPTTGLGGGWRVYWSHPQPGTSPAPINRALIPIEAPSPPADQTPPQQRSVGDWRWRFTWVCPPFGGHIGIDYVRSGTPRVRHVDYGQPPDCGGCNLNCCIPLVKFTNNRWDPNRPVITVFGAHYRPWQNGFGSISTCFDNNLPRHWGQCCQYFFLGIWPWSNSNGGAHAAIHRCVSNPRHPPSNWRFFAPGWSNSNLPANNGSCPGYCAVP